jgi:hypothetical protein
MDGDERRNRMKTFVIGGLVGASAVLAAARRRQPVPRPSPRRGLSAFEDAPCFREQAARDESSRSR